MKVGKWNGRKENGGSGFIAALLENGNQTGRTVETVIKVFQPARGWKLKHIWVVTWSNAPARQQHGRRKDGTANGLDRIMAIRVFKEPHVVTVLRFLPPESCCGLLTKW